MYHVIVADCLITPQLRKVLIEICGDSVEFHRVDLQKSASVPYLSALKFDGVIHLAALKAVGESVSKPLEYYSNNINSLLHVLEAMKNVDCKMLVYSSSATVYKPSEELLCENSPLGPSNPYGQTKLIGEQILLDLFISDPSLNISILRYFNPVGNVSDGKIGESPEKPQNILPIIQKVSVGKLPFVPICGNDWPTRDGTGIRDYIHVLDLADGHVLALNKLFSSSKPVEVLVHNLGTGKGVSVFELIEAFEKAAGIQIPTQVVERRPGDLATVIADPSKAQTELGFLATRTIE